MYIAKRFIIKNGKSSYTVKEFDDLEKAKDYGHKYSYRSRFNGLKIENENGELIYEITDGREVIDHIQIKYYQNIKM